MIARILIKDLYIALHVTKKEDANHSLLMFSNSRLNNQTLTSHDLTEHLKHNFMFLQTLREKCKKKIFFLFLKSVKNVYHLVIYLSQCLSFPGTCVRGKKKKNYNTFNKNICYLYLGSSKQYDKMHF